MRAWVIRAPDVATFTAFEREGLVGIRGGPPEGAITDDLSATDEEGIGRLVADAGSPPVQATVLSAFVISAEVGDAIVTPEPGGKPGRDILLGRIAGGYEHHDPPRVADIRHVRRVDWEERLPRVMLPSEFWQGRARAVTEAPLDDLRELLGL